MGHPADGRRIFSIFPESYLYCAPKGVNYMQKRTGKIRNGIKCLGIIFGLRDLTKNRDQGTGNRAEAGLMRSQVPKAGPFGFAQRRLWAPNHFGMVRPGPPAKPLNRPWQNAMPDTHLGSALVRMASRDGLLLQVSTGCRE